MKQRMNKFFLALALVLLTQIGFSALQEMSDQDLSEVSGQALLDINKYDHMGNNFYRIKMNSLVTTNLNIDELRLRGPDGSGGIQDQISIDDLSLSGDANGISDGNLSSARIRNPYIEFAFAGTTSAGDLSSDREIVGIRFGADSITGWMSFGDDAVTGPSGANPSGINAFRGYIETETVTGTAGTNSLYVPAHPVGSYRAPYAARLVFLGIEPTALDPSNSYNANPCNPIGSTGLTTIRGCMGVTADAEFTVPTLSGINFSAPGVVVDSSLPATLGSNNGVVTSVPLTASNTNTVSTDNNSSLSELPITATVTSRNTGGGLGALVAGILINVGDEIDLQAENIIIPAGNLQLTVNESFGFLHRAELTGVAGFISAQNRTVHWQGARAANGAQAGWWMELTNPIDLGSLTIPNIDIPYDPSNPTAPSIITDIMNSAIPQLQSTNHAGAITGDVISIAPFSTGVVSETFTDLPVSVLPITNCWNGVIGC